MTTDDDTKCDLSYQNLTKDQIDKWREVASRASRERWCYGTSGDDGRAYMLECFDRGEAGPVGTVFLEDDRVIAITGNGPTSEANAKFIAWSCPANVMAALDALADARTEIERLRAEAAAREVTP